MKKLFLLIGMILFICGCANTTVTTAYLRQDQYGLEGGYAQYNKSRHDELTYEVRHAKKQDLGNKKYHISEVTKINENKYTFFGTDRETFEVGYFVETKNNMMDILERYTANTDYKRIGW